MGMRLLLTGFAPLACAGLLSSCVGDEVPSYTCDMADVGEVLSGTWSLSANGKRDRCDDRRLDGELELELSIPLEVTATAQATLGPAFDAGIENEADAFVERIRRADFVLSADDMPDQLEAVVGSTVGSCVSISLVERLPGGDHLSYLLEGYIISPREVVGDLTGTGPENCRVTGSFELTIR